MKSSSSIVYARGHLFMRFFPFRLSITSIPVDLFDICDKEMKTDTHTVCIENVRTQMQYKGKTG